jgi:hypothetical protein
MIHITILRAMVKAGANLDVVLTAIEADQLLGEQMAQARRARALAARTFRGNAAHGQPLPATNVTNVTNVSARRTIQQAASDLLSAVSAAAAHGGDPIRN